VELDQLGLFEHGAYRCREAIQIALDTFDVPKLRAMIEKRNRNSEIVITATKKTEITKIRHEMVGRQLSVDHNLLEELFEDYQFLRELELDPDPILKGYVTSSLDYLDGRIEFWRARNPKGTHELTVVDQISKPSKSVNRSLNYLKEEITKHVLLPSISK
jgi:hypothetical protein